jgi:MOSC domain-containing protein YiiM
MKIVSIAVSRKKGTTKTPVEEAFVTRDHGLEGDAHAGPWHRQVSLLASESIDAARAQGLEVGFGDFAENIATVGVDWKILPVGTRARLGRDVVLEITQIGKECHTRCAIFYKAGDCIMPREGVFARVIHEGMVRRGDPIELLPVASRGAGEPAAD